MVSLPKTVIFTAVDAAFLAAGIVGGYLPGKEEEQPLLTTKHESDKSSFLCGVCHVKYKEDFLGAETVQEGKICRFCLGKKQKGETK